MQLRFCFLARFARGFPVSNFSSFLVSHLSFLMSRSNFPLTHSHFSFLISHFSFLISHFSFLISHFTMTACVFSVFCVSCWKVLLCFFSVLPFCDYIPVFPVFLFVSLGFWLCFLARFPRGILVSHLSSLILRVTFLLISRFSCCHVSRFSFSFSFLSFLISHFSFLISHFPFLIACWLRVYDFMFVCLMGLDCLIVWLFDCLIVWLFDCLIVWLFDCLISLVSLIGLIGLIAWLLDCLIAWLLDCLILIAWFWLLACLIAWLLDS